MLVKTYNQKAEEIEQTKLPEEIFGVSLNSDLAHQVVVSQMSNRRQVSAHAKTRAEVRGGGKKPWQQKGTGRARHGSIRSPLWRGGGVTFGPRKEKNYKKLIPKKMRRQALLMILSAKAKAKLLIVLDELKIEKTKTKEMARILNVLPCQGKSSLIALSKMNKKTILSTKNIPKIATIQAKDLNCLDLLSYKYLIITKDVIKIIKETFLK
jgi:large subunit ribosomal protein L4